MNDIPDNAFWICVWLIVASSILGIAICVTMYTIDKNTTIANSDNPIVTACALSNHDPKPCMAYLGSLK